MLKLIFKNLWSRRRRNGWLLAELILVSVLCWIILDPVIVLTHDRHIPLNYDADRLCMVSLGGLIPQAPGYSEEAQDSAGLVDNYLQLVRLAQDFEGVETATPVLGYSYPNSEGYTSSGYFAENDSISHPMMVMYFVPHTRFFETYGLQATGSMSARQLSDSDYGPNDIILTENAARNVFGTAEAIHRRCCSYTPNDTIYYPVVGIVRTFKAYNEWRPVPVCFKPLLEIDSDNIPEAAHILLCLREGVSMERFLHDFRPWMVRELRRGNLFARTVSSYDDIIAARESATSAPIYRRNLAMAVFFLVNLCLGVVGTFWLQTRTRREEVGIMLSFGGTPGHIRRLLLGEGAVLTLLAALVGFFLYLQYAISEGLDPGLCWMKAAEADYWVVGFWSHFLGVSAIIFLLLQAVVLVGIYIPARNISRIPPTEALRDE